MAENLQTTRPADEGWTTVIRPKTGWFDIDLQELWRYRDLIMMFVILCTISEFHFSL